MSADPNDTSLAPQLHAPRKLKLATASLAGCFGCHMSFLDMDERRKFKETAIRSVLKFTTEPL